MNDADQTFMKCSYKVFFSHLFFLEVFLPPSLFPHLLEWCHHESFTWRHIFHVFIRGFLSPFFFPLLYRMMSSWISLLEVFFLPSLFPYFLGWCHHKSFKCHFFKLFSFNSWLKLGKMILPCRKINDKWQANKSSQLSSCFSFICLYSKVNSKIYRHFSS